MKGKKPKGKRRAWANLSIYVKNHPSFMYNILCS